MSYISLYISTSAISKFSRFLLPQAEWDIITLIFHFFCSKNKHFLGKVGILFLIFNQCLTGKHQFVTSSTSQSKCVIRCETFLFDRSRRCLSSCWTLNDPITIREYVIIDKKSFLLHYQRICGSQYWVGPCSFHFVSAQAALKSLFDAMVTLETLLTDLALNGSCSQSILIPLAAAIATSCNSQSSLEFVATTFHDSLRLEWHFASPTSNLLDFAAPTVDKGKEIRFS